MTPLIREMVGLLPDSETLMWFDLGGFGVATVPKGHLPFPKCAVVARSQNGTKMLLVCVQNELALSAVSYALLKDRYITSPQVNFARVKDEWTLLEDDGDKEARAFTIAMLGEFMARTVKTGYQGTPRRSSILNQQRARKGKPPLQYEWRTVEVTPPQARSEPQGGTHASPRQHDRRGHYRTLKSGSRVWVKSCKVGSASAGAVFKDYIV